MKKWRKTFVPLTLAIMFQGRIEEGDGLYEVQSTTSGSDDDQGLSLIEGGGGELPGEDESSLSILMQVMLPFLVAGLGMVGAGLVLDLVQVMTTSTCWCERVYQNTYRI